MEEWRLRQKTENRAIEKNQQAADRNGLEAMRKDCTRSEAAQTVLTTLQCESEPHENDLRSG